MTEDPLVAEIHAIRAKMLRECGGDMHKLIVRIHRQAQKLGIKTVCLPRPRITAQHLRPAMKTSPCKRAKATIVHPA